MTIDLAPIRARLSARTPGQWLLCDDGDLRIIVDDGAVSTDICTLYDEREGGDKEAEANGVFIKHAPEDIKALCDEVEQIRALALSTLTEAIRAAVLAEREHCALVCEAVGANAPVGGDLAFECAEKVRMRGVGGVR